MSKVLAVVLILLLSFSACGNRTTTPPDKDSPTGLETRKREPLPGEVAAGEVAAGEVAIGQEGFQPGLEPEVPITMSPAQTSVPATTPSSSPPSSSPSSPEPPSVPAVRTPATRPSVVQPSRSLAGHDRFLVSRPFGGVRPADFELGLLLDRKTDPPLGALLNGLAQALMEKTLKAASFSSQALMLAELLYNPDLVSGPGVLRIRFSEARQMPGAAYTFGIRLFSETGYANGLAILGTDDANSWLIEHLDLDLRGLREQTIRSKPWDPYGYSRNLFD